MALLINPQNASLAHANMQCFMGNNETEKEHNE